MFFGSNLNFSIRHNSKTLLPGGCALNTCRALRWLDPSPRSSSVLFVGSAGDDDNRAALESIVRSDGVEPRFSVHPSRPTGHCVALVRGMERTMCANVGAADEFSADDYDSLGMDGVLEKADVVYLTRFAIKTILKFQTLNFLFFSAFSLSTAGTWSSESPPCAHDAPPSA